MAAVHVTLLALAVLVALSWDASAEGLSGDLRVLKKARQEVWTGEVSRAKRQSEMTTTTTTTTTTAKPKKHRPSNIFSLFSELVKETKDDTSRAFNEIGTLFNGQFANSTTKKEPTTTTPATSSSSDSDEDNEITTTTEPFRITRDEFFGILRSNVQGIVNLFGKEFRVAIKDSNQSAREFGRDLGLALTAKKNSTKSKD